MAPIGYVMLSIASKKEHNVYNALSKLQENKTDNVTITNIDPVFGEHDFIIRLEAEDHAILGKYIVERVRSIPGVIGTKTLAGIKF
ncbi:MAG: Lrp/AsnC ligand binding domain-containing protein [Nanoarchaeota archaeon]|nr:Lrp/AsnC ligand binding domain-containing protein [Nanoarchaeota archaeon]MBU4124425.1 Lrp/AsnC ligand binding domain-containing protein [Nanoarchaeota archaeon]